VLTKWPIAQTYLLIFVVDDFGLFVSLEPHHEFGVEPPRHLLQRLRGQVLSLSALHIVEDEEEHLWRQPLKELDLGPML